MSDMFGVDDTPLFSQTPVPVEETPFAPTARSTPSPWQWVEMFDEEMMPEKDRQIIDSPDAELYTRAAKTLDALLKSQWTIRNGMFSIENRWYVALRSRLVGTQHRLLAVRLVRREEYTGETWRAHGHIPGNRALAGKELNYTHLWWIVTDEEIVVTHDTADMPTQETLF